MCLAGVEHLRARLLKFDSAALGFTALTLMLSLQASYAAPLLLLAQNRQDDRDKVSLQQDRQRAERNLADTEYLTRELASLRIAIREVATRDFVRSELRSVLEELLEVRRIRMNDAVRAGAGRLATRTGRKKQGFRRDVLAARRPPMPKLAAGPERRPGVLIHELIHTRPRYRPGSGRWARAGNGDRPGASPAHRRTGHAQGRPD